MKKLLVLLFLALLSFQLKAQSQLDSDNEKSVKLTYLPWIHLQAGSLFASDVDSSLGIKFGGSMMFNFQTRKRFCYGFDPGVSYCFTKLYVDNGKRGRTGSLLVQLPFFLGFKGKLGTPGLAFYGGPYAEMGLHGKIKGTNTHLYNNCNSPVSLRSCDYGIMVGISFVHFFYFEGLIGHAPENEKRQYRINLGLKVPLPIL